jgi:hypothetical protein
MLDRGLLGNYPETGLWKAPNFGFQGTDESQLAMAESRLLIALHSPNALLETGLRMCPPEKSQGGDRLRC